MVRGEAVVQESWDDCGVAFIRACALVRKGRSTTGRGRGIDELEMIDLHQVSTIRNIRMNVKKGYKNPLLIECCNK